MAEKPKTLTIRAYQVGFGDCFLLTFHYPMSERHVLIDFGTRSLPKGLKDPDKHMRRVADDVKARCKGKLHAVVATHRHQDHISGFATAADGKGSGDVIAACKPSVVVQPWTEHPDAARNATRAPLTKTLLAMHEFAAGTVADVKRMRGVASAIRDELRFTGENNISNPSAVKNLMTMGPNRYVNAGSVLNLDKLLPGVKVHVLGPPTLEQSSSIRKEARTHPEFWKLQKQLASARQAFWRLQVHSAQAGRRRRKLFPNAPRAGNPIHARWLRRQLHDVRGENLLEIVRILDAAMNNTSVILLLEAGSKRLLFPGDAQIENWAYALAQKKYAKLLEDVHVYKVGHHGSTNATPRINLWEKFKHRSDHPSPKRMLSLLSTLHGVYPGKSKETAVPQATLVKALEAKTEYFSTETLGGSKLYSDILIPLT